MKILLKASALNEYDNGANCFLLELTAEGAKELLARRELFQVVQSKDKGLYALTFWSLPGEFYDICEDTLHELLGGLVSEFNTNEHIVVPDGFVLYGSEEAASEDDDDTDVGGIRTEVEMTFITESGVYFRAGLKHSSTYVESRLLPFELLLPKGK